MSIVYTFTLTLNRILWIVIVTSCRVILVEEMSVFNLLNII